MEELTKYNFLHTFNPVQRINATTVKERLSRKPHQLFIPHRLDFYMVCLFTSGHGKHMVDFNEVDVSPGKMLIITPGQIHSFDPSEGYDANTVVFTADFFNRTELHQKFLSRSPLFNVAIKISQFDIKKNMLEFNYLYNAIVKELKSPVDQYQGDLLCNHLFTMLLMAERLLEPEYKTAVMSREILLISSFKSVVEKKLHEHWTVKQYADYLNVSPRTLQNSFRNVTDITPKEWLKDRLLLEIKRKLLFSTLTISEVSYHLGFKDISYFVRFFKKLSGITPAYFRTKNRL
ncbi:MAG: AraC family transcriptional regulator [Sphingobacterium sp.]|jgi:AraC-like DNA-binding protein|nr:AraC family transcriptional regulator [Sphingobacterium sp.]